MGIGTSLGAFFDSELDHHAGNDTGGPPVPQPEVVDPTGNTRDENAYTIEGDTNTKSDTPQPIADITQGGRNRLRPFTEPQFGGGVSLDIPERVGKAALKLDNGELFEDINHGMAFGRIMDKYPQIENFSGIKQGFTTSKGRFVSREEAFDIAKQQNQINPKVLPALTADSKMLLSEDLQ